MLSQVYLFPKAVLEEKLHETFDKKFFLVRGNNYPMYPGPFDKGYQTNLWNPVQVFSIGQNHTLLSQFIRC